MSPKERKRKIPIFKITGSGKNYDAIINHPQIKKAIIDELLFAVKEGINKNKKSISLFEIYNSNLIIELERNNWKESLNTAMEYFIEIEDYNKCIEIREMVKKL